MQRNIMMTIAAVLLIGLGLLWAEGTPDVERPESPEATIPPTKDLAKPVDLVICLDTSGSMSGLIESAKQKLWAVVNELATARPRPALRVALYHYGNNGLDKETGWVQQLCELTDDLDTVYGKLFALRTNGGSEYVARVVRAATDQLSWSDDPAALKIIFVAGNEPATQDPTYPLKDICAAAVAKGIIINTIHCGDVETGRQTGWADAAKWADGQYAAIDQDHGTVVISTPHDTQLDELSRKLNTTYLAYGAAGHVGLAEQAAQDANAATVGGAAAAQRGSAKATALYRNVRWDLVDASQEEGFDLAKIKDADLPEEMRSMDLPQRKALTTARSSAC